MSVSTHDINFDEVRNNESADARLRQGRPQKVISIDCLDGRPEITLHTRGVFMMFELPNLALVRSEMTESFLQEQNTASSLSNSLDDLPERHSTLHLTGTCPHCRHSTPRYF